MTPPSSGDVTQLLLRWHEGSELARAELIRLVYRDLRAHAGRLLRAERGDHTLQPTALIHETYERLVDQRRVQWQNRAHFFAVAAGLMRRILVDHARRRGAVRRGRDPKKVELADDVAAAPAAPDVDVIAVDRALGELAALDPDQARIVELRFFGGLSVEETAEAMGISRATVHREWAMARAWLHRRLEDPVGAG
jgi:RNA polymerase sigma factor (TIGR02999 family)